MPRRGATAGWRSWRGGAGHGAARRRARARAAPLFGFNDSPETFAVDAGAAHRAGATKARVPVSWELSSPSPGTTTDGRRRRRYGKAARDVRVLFVLSAAPAWAAAECDSVWIATCGVGDGFAPAYVRFGERLLRRYPGSELQAWNEPDIAGVRPDERSQSRAPTRAKTRAPGQVIGPAASPSDPEAPHDTGRHTAESPPACRRGCTCTPAPRRCGRAGFTPIGEPPGRSPVSGRSGRPRSETPRASTAHRDRPSGRRARIVSSRVTALGRSSTTGSATNTWTGPRG